MLAFVQLLGTLVANLFRSQRLEVENHLLGRSTLSLTEVASMCGLADAEYLERAFTRSVGVYPLLWNPKERTGFNGAHGRSAAGAVTAHLRTDPAYPDFHQFRTAIRGHQRCFHVSCRLAVSEARLALPNFYNVTIRIANVAERLAVLFLWLCDKLGSSISP